MPKKALVALGVVLACGLSALPAPARGSDSGIASHPGDTAPNISGRRQAEAALALDEILNRTLRLNPDLAAFSREVEARGFEAGQAGLRPNPELSVEVENVAGTGGVETTLRVSQLLERGAKREKRLKAGELDQALAEREYEAARTDLVADAKERYVRALSAKKRLELAAERLSLAGRVLATVEERISAGKIPALEKIRFSPLVTEARLHQEKAKQEMDTSLLALAASWGGDPSDLSGVVGSLEDLPPLPSWEAAVSDFRVSPRLAAFRARVESTDAGLAVERAGSIRDLTLSLGARNDSDTGDNSLVAELSIPLQLFDSNRGAVGAARSRLEKAKDEERGALLEMRTALAEAWRGMSAARLEVELLQEEILPARRQAFEDVSYGYGAGKFGFLELLDAERGLFEARDRHALALGDYHRAAVLLERLLGCDLADLGEKRNGGES